MCGIAGSLGAVDGDRVRRMTAALVHRGPDSAGHHARGDLHLGVRRLSIVGIDSGDQPIYNEAGDKAIVFNGEIYNYRQLQRHLRERGHELATESDSEVVLHLYEEYGPACVEHLRGMFAFAIDDGGSLFLARDRLGIKPLFYAHLAERGLFLFASEIKALLRCPEVGSGLDHQGLVDALVSTYPVGARTLFRDVCSVEPGCTLEVTRSGERTSIETRRYYRMQVEPDPSITLAEAERELEALLAETVRGHLSGEVEVGLLLSGGLDSSLLAALTAEAVGGRYRAFTAATDEGDADLAGARRVAASLPVEHEIVHPSFDEYLASIPHFVGIRETTLPSLSGLAALHLMRRVGERLKVCLCGEGSDEIFGGYSEFYGLLRPLRRLRRSHRRMIELGCRPSPALGETIDGLFAHEAGSDDALLAFFRYNQGDVLVRQHLDFHDRVGMAASVEVRVPFMDHVVVELANRLPLAFKVQDRPRVGKYILRRLANRRFADSAGRVAGRAKLGMPNACSGYCQRFETLCRELLPADYLDRHELGRFFTSRPRLLLFELFELVFVESRGTVPADLDAVDFIRSRSQALPPSRRSVSAAPAPVAAPTTTIGSAAPCPEIEPSR